MPTEESFGRFIKCVDELCNLNSRLLESTENPGSLRHDLLVELLAYQNVLEMLRDTDYLDSVYNILFKED